MRNEIYVGVSILIKMCDCFAEINFIDDAEMLCMLDQIICEDGFNFKC